MLTLEFIAPAVLVLLAVVIVLYTQVIVPRAQRRQLTALFEALGWVPADPDGDAGCAEVVRLAIEGSRGGASVSQSDERVGPLMVGFESRQWQTGKVIAAFRDAAASRPRCAALGVKSTRWESRLRRVPLAGGTPRTSVGRELWIGEARPLPLDRTVTVYSGFAGMFGEHVRRLAERRGRDPATLDQPIDEPSDQLPAAIRRLAAGSQAASDAMATIYAGPSGWVLVVPMGRLGRRAQEVVDLACAVSGEIDRAEQWHGPAVRA